MKKQLIYTAFLATASVMLPACDEKEPAAPETAETQAAEQPAAPQTPAQPTEEELKAMLTEQLPECPYAEPAGLSCELPQKNEDGSFNLAMTLTMVLRENMYARESTPESFNKEREAVNEAANAAMQPESVYLLQVGAPTEMLTEADRAAKPLPEDLQSTLNEMKDLAYAAVFTQKLAAGAEIPVAATCRASYADGAWHFDNVNLDTNALTAPADLTAESAVAELGGAVLTPEFEETRKQEIAAKVAAFNEAAAPYIQGREEAARATLTQHQAAEAEEAARVAEQEQAAAAARTQWENLCAAAVADGKDFAGEWTRGNKYGELTLHIEQAKRLDGSIQFFGTLYDTKLPAACLDITGRCELTETAEGALVNITIYDGQYNMDEPTAEVYDARDGLLVLHLDKEGKLSGVMTCAAWGTESERAFTVKLSPKKAETKSSKSRR